MEIRNCMFKMVRFVGIIFGICEFVNGQNSLGNKYPYGSCEQFTIGGTGNSVTKPYPMHDGSTLSYFPLTSEHTTLHLHIHISNVVYKVIVSGTFMILKECSGTGTKCTVVQEEGRKTKDYIIPYRWNEILAHVKNNAISITISNTTVMTMAMKDSMATEMLSATWYVTVSSGEGVKTSKINFPFYKVQFQCAGLTTQAEGLRSSVVWVSITAAALVVLVMIGVLILVVTKSLRSKSSDITDQTNLK